MPRRVEIEARGETEDGLTRYTLKVGQREFGLLVDQPFGRVHISDRQNWRGYWVKLDDLAGQARLVELVGPDGFSKVLEFLV